MGGITSLFSSRKKELIEVITSVGGLGGKYNAL